MYSNFRSLSFKGRLKVQNYKLNKDKKPNMKTFKLYSGINLNPTAKLGFCPIFL